MSSPITVAYSTDPGTALLAAALIAAGAAIARGYTEAAALRGEHAQARQDDAARQTSAITQGLAALQQAATAAQIRFDQLTRLAERLGHGDTLRAAQPAPPDATDIEALAAHVRSLDALATHLRHTLLTEAACQAGDFAELTQELGTALTDYADLGPIRRDGISAHLLARIAHLGPIPAELTALAVELDASLPGERAELLATELRLRVQQQLEAVRALALQQANATIIEQTLKDLGYVVEPIEHTLYLAGGAVHFCRPGWGDYLVRMRLDFKRSSANFNVIRAVDEGDNTRSQLDHIAEDRWCAEFPALMQALEARGVLLQVTRRIEPGDLPVQLVARTTLPRFTNAEEDETSHHHTAPQTRELK